MVLSSDSSEDEETASDDDAAVESADANDEQHEEWMQQFFEQEALDAGDETHEEYDDDEPNTGDLAFINDEDTESNYDEDSCTWSEQEEEQQHGDISLGSTDTDSCADHEAADEYE